MQYLTLAVGCTRALVCRGAGVWAAPELRRRLLYGSTKSGRQKQGDADEGRFRCAGKHGGAAGGVLWTTVWLCWSGLRHRAREGCHRRKMMAGRTAHPARDGRPRRRARTAARSAGFPKKMTWFGVATSGERERTARTHLFVSRCTCANTRDSAAVRRRAVRGAKLVTLAARVHGSECGAKANHPSLSSFIEMKMKETSPLRGSGITGCN